MKFGQVDDLDIVNFSLPSIDKISKRNLSIINTTIHTIGFQHMVRFIK